MYWSLLLPQVVPFSQQPAIGNHPARAHPWRPRSHTGFTPPRAPRSRRACDCAQVTLLFRFANGDQAEVSNADGRTLVQRLWRMGVGRASRDGLALSVAISDAFVDDFTVDVQDADLAALEQVLFGLGATMQLTPGLSALRVLVNRD